jgi:hypothetical protein
VPPAKQLFPRLKKFHLSVLVDALCNAFVTRQRSDAFHAPQAVKDYPDLFLDPEMFASLAFCTSDQSVSAVFRCSGFIVNHS